MTESFGRANATGRSGSKPMPRDAKLLKVDGPFVMLTVALLASEAVRTLSIHGMRMLLRLVIEHHNHRQLENGRLIVTHAQAVEFGITRRFVTEGIAELELRGLICREAFSADVTTGRRPPNRFRLTFAATVHDGAPATNEWRRWRKPEKKRSPKKNGSPATTEGTDLPPPREPKARRSPPQEEPEPVDIPPPLCGPTIICRSATPRATASRKAKVTAPTCNCSPTSPDPPNPTSGDPDGNAAANSECGESKPKIATRRGKGRTKLA